MRTKPKLFFPNEPQETSLELFLHVHVESELRSIRAERPGRKREEEGGNEEGRAGRGKERRLSSTFSLTPERMRTPGSEARDGNSWKPPPPFPTRIHPHPPSLTCHLELPQLSGEPQGVGTL